MPVDAFIAGGIIWGDKTIQAAELGNEETPARGPIGTDPSWNLMRAYLQDKDTGHRHTGAVDGGRKILGTDIDSTGQDEEFLASALGVSTWRKGLFRVYIGTDYVPSGGETFPRLHIEEDQALLDEPSTSIGAVSVKLNLHPDLSGYQSASSSHTQIALVGTVLTPPIGLATLGTFSAVPLVQGQGGTISTINVLEFSGNLIGTTATSLTNRNFVRAGGAQTGTGWTITNQRGLLVAMPTPSGSVTNNRGIEIQTIGGGTNREGIKNFSSWHFARFDAKAISYTMISNDYGIKGTGGAGGITITLPAASLIGHRVFIVKVDAAAGAVTVSRAGTDTIEGNTTVALASQWESIELIADGVSTWTRCDL